MAAGQKRAAREGRRILLLDESGFMLQPVCRRTRAPRGETPVLRCWDRRDRRGVIGGLLPSPRRRRVRLVWRMHRRNVRTGEVFDFVRRQLAGGGRISLVLDRLPAHRAVVPLLRATFGDRVCVEWLPAYAPDLNPAEGPWNHAKYTDLANFAAHDIAHLARRVGQSLYRQSRRRSLLLSYFRLAGLRL